MQTEKEKREVPAAVVGTGDFIRKMGQALIEHYGALVDQNTEPEAAELKKAVAAHKISDFTEKLAEKVDSLLASAVQVNQDTEDLKGTAKDNFIFPPPPPVAPLKSQKVDILPDDFRS